MDALPGCARVSNSTELAAHVTRHRGAIAFVDLELVAKIDCDLAGLTVVAISEGAVSELVTVLLGYPRVSHVLSATLLKAPSLGGHLEELCERIQRGPEQTVAGGIGIGRAALFTSSERRAARLERVVDFFTAQGVRPKTIAALSDIAEELMTNALYDAPREAGCFHTAVSRTAPIELRPDQACEISYGVYGERLFVRVRDPFGSLTRQRLLQVLDRCRRKDVPLDESRGGAGLGIWRVFSQASGVTIAVIPGRLTDFLVYMDANARRMGGNLQTVQLIYPDEFALDGIAGRFAADHDFDLMDDSFTALLA